MYVDVGVIFCGGRDYRDRRKVISVLRGLRDDFGEFICIQGGADGADALVREFAIANAWPCLTVPANWHQWGKAAGPKRNRLMLEICREPLAVVAFPGGRGTRNMLKQAEEWRVHQIIRVDGD